MLGMCVIVILALIVGGKLLGIWPGRPSSSKPEEKMRYDLSNPNADENTRLLMEYLFDIYGKQMLSGQYCVDTYGKKELMILRNETGELPAVVGFDFILSSPSLIKAGGISRVVDWAVEEAGDGAIITFCWHWNPPEQYVTGEYWQGFRTENTNIDLDAVMSGEDKAGYELLLRDMDVIAGQLCILQKEGIPVIWRPLHEASGGWFWWGNCRPESYKKLYRLMYERFTEKWELNNLIWLWNGMDREWYPGDDVVDLIGEDIYTQCHNYSPHAEQFKQAQEQYTDTFKMVVLSETGVVPDPRRALSEGALWGFFCLWSGPHLCREDSCLEMSEEYTSRKMLRQVYASKYVVTRRELPPIYSGQKKSVDTESMNR